VPAWTGDALASERREHSGDLLAGLLLDRLKAAVRVAFHGDPMAGDIDNAAPPRRADVN
jgi:hypothetical protein